MKPIKIKIFKLGMIQDSTVIELNRFMIFSGESGLGKSYLSIICHYIFSVLLDNNRISGFFNSLGYFNLEDSKPGLSIGPVTLRITKGEFENWLSKDAITWLGYMIGNADIDGKIEIRLPDNIPDIIEFKLTEEMVGLGDNVETYVNMALPGLSYKVKDSIGIEEESPFAFLFRFYLVQQIFGGINELKSSFIFPPSRGMMLTELVTPITGMYMEFKKDLQQMVMAKPEKVQPPKKLKSLIQDILEGHVNYKDGRYFYSTNGTEIPLSAGAASIRELASLEFMINNTDISKSSIMIDEPEAHLHPLKQRMMADILTCLVEAGAFVQVTTHSDYFLRRINELVLKFKILKKFESQGDPSGYYRICDEMKENPEIMVNPENISAYLLKRTDSNSSMIIKQNMDKGVPFASFHEALELNLKKKFELENILNDEGD